MPFCHRHPDVQVITDDLAITTYLVPAFRQIEDAPAYQVGRAP